MRLKEIDHLISQQRCIGRKRKINFFLPLSRRLFRVGNNCLEQLKVEQCFATEETDTHLAGFVPAFWKRKSTLVAGSIPIHLHRREPYFAASGS